MNVLLDNRPSELGTEVTPHQRPILQSVSAHSPSLLAAPAPDFRRSPQAGGRGTSGAAVSAPSRWPRPLPADLTRSAALSGYKQQALVSVEQQALASVLLPALRDS